jgi:hypothetical protein
MMRNTLPPMTRLEAAVFAIIYEQPPGAGITGKEIIRELPKKGFTLDQSSLTGRIIPKLKLRGVKNRRGAGYYYDEPR